MKNKKSLKIGTSIEKNMTSETIISEKWIKEQCQYSCSN